MTKNQTEEIKKEVEEQEEQIYGEEGLDNSEDSQDEDVDQKFADFTGEPPKGENIAKVVNKQEKALQEE